MAKADVPHIQRAPETFNYLDKFTLTKGDSVEISSKSYYKDSNGVRHKAGVQGIFTFLCAVSEGILVKEKGQSGTIYVFLGAERKLELTGTVLKPHILKLPKKKGTKRCRTSKNKSEET